MSGKGARAFTDRLLMTAPLEATQQREERLDDAVRAEQIHGEVLFECGPSLKSS